MANINKPVPDTTDELERKYLVHNVMNDDSDEEMGRKARLEFDSDVSLSEDEADIAKHKHNDDCAHEEQGEDWSKVLSQQRPKGNTGVKGVRADYEEASRIVKRRNETKLLKQMEALKATGAQSAVEVHSKNVNDTTSKKHAKQQSKDEDNAESDDDEDDDDEFFKAFRAERLNQLRAIQGLPRFGFLRQVDRYQFVDFVGEADKRTYVVIHLFEDYLSACKRMNGILESLAERFPHIMFLKLQATEADQTLSHSQLPAFLVYKADKLCGDATIKTEFDGDKFTVEDVEWMLCAKYGIQLPGVDVTQKEKESMQTKALQEKESKAQEIFRVKR